ncbi:MAG: FAD-dependent monooxygenase [Xanthobacteraceae bacterium]|jgi:2-polyprenyl-6-methoxyphenol hydroxylase-like FAD-dependent oxidoreductase
MTQSRPNIVIVGGGIGGLFVANALVSQGLRVSVYEQAPALGEVGAGVYITPNCVRQLQRVGLGPAVEKWGAKVGNNSRYFHHDGTLIAPVRVTDSSGWNATYGMHRADLVDMLAKALPAGVVHTGHRCTGFERHGDIARVSFENGAVAEGDVVIGADGIHSELRQYVFPASRPVFSGTVAYRGVVRSELVPEWPAESWEMWLGKGKHFLTYPLRAGALINFVGFVPVDKEMKESWSAAGDPEALRREFADWDPRIGVLLRHVKTTFRSALHDRDPLPTWTRGRLTLLGDAAHAMLPHLGQGANQSIEDGMALATILTNTDRTTVLAGLLAYERLRRERTAKVQSGARENGLRYDSFHGDITIRDAEIAAHAEFRKHLYDHDVVPEACAAAAELV